MVQITNPLDFINGLFSLIVVITSFIVAFLILMKYRELKSKEFLYWGIAFSGIYNPWWPASISFIMILTTGNPLPLCYYNIIGIIPLPFFFLLWMVGFHKQIYPEKRKIILPIYTIIAILMEIYILYHFFTNQCEVLAIKQPGLFDIKLGTINAIYNVFLSLSFASSGMLVVYKLFKSKERKLRIKAYFLSITFLSHPICGFFDSALNLNEVTLVIIRLIMVFASICLYIGMFLPNFIKKLLKIED